MKDKRNWVTGSGSHLCRTEINRIKIHSTTRNVGLHICHGGQRVQKMFLSTSHNWSGSVSPKFLFFFPWPCHRSNQSLPPQRISAQFYIWSKSVCHVCSLPLISWFIFLLELTEIMGKEVMTPGYKTSSKVVGISFMFLICSFIIYETRLYGLLVMHAGWHQGLEATFAKSQTWVNPACMGNKPAEQFVLISKPL